VFSGGKSRGTYKKRRAVKKEDFGGGHPKSRTTSPRVIWRGLERNATSFVGGKSTILIENGIKKDLTTAVPEKKG